MPRKKKAEGLFDSVAEDAPEGSVGSMIDQRRQLLEDLIKQEKAIRSGTARLPEEPPPGVEPTSGLDQFAPMWAKDGEVPDRPEPLRPQTDLQDNGMFDNFFTMKRLIELQRLIEMMKQAGYGMLLGKDEKDDDAERE